MVLSYGPLDFISQRPVMRGQLGEQLFLGRVGRELTD
jgi:hypothetical protein